MIFVAGDRELASGNLNHLPVGAQQLTGGSRANISPPAARSCFKCIEEGWHWATVHSHEDPAITCVCLGALSNTVGSAAEGGRRPTKPTREASWPCRCQRRVCFARNNLCLWGGRLTQEVTKLIMLHR